MTTGLADKRQSGARGGTALAGMARAVGAWLVADLTAAMTLLLGFGVLEYLHRPATPEAVGQYLLTALPLSLYVGIMIAILTALPMLAIVFLMRLTRIRRGIGDVLLSGVMGALLVQLIMTTASTSETAATTLLFFIAGMAGGLTYWQVAGRPH